MFTNCLADDVPIFTWDKENLSGFGIPLLNVQYPNGETEVIHLKRSEEGFNQSGANENICIFNGYLENDPNSMVLLSGGCPFSDNFDVSFKMQS